MLSLLATRASNSARVTQPLWILTNWLPLASYLTVRPSSLTKGTSASTPSGRRDSPEAAPGSPPLVNARLSSRSVPAAGSSTVAADAGSASLLIIVEGFSGSAAGTVWSWSTGDCWSCCAAAASDAGVAWSWAEASTAGAAISTMGCWPSSVTDGSASAVVGIRPTTSDKDARMDTSFVVIFFIVNRPPF